MSIQRLEGGRQPVLAEAVFTHAAVAESLSVPTPWPIKPVYVHAFVRLVDRVRQA